MEDVELNRAVEDALAAWYGAFSAKGVVPEVELPDEPVIRRLDREALVLILKEPKSALIKKKHQLFAFDEVELEFEEDAIEAIADKAFERKTGARGLRSIMENVMMNVMYEIPSDDTIETCEITKEAV